MTLTLKGRLLGLGSIIELASEDYTGRYVVLARGGFRTEKESSEVIPRYLVGPHPYGEAPDQESFPILDTEIESIVFEGYTDEKDQEFLDSLLDMMENGKPLAKRAEQFKASLTEIPEVEIEDLEEAEVKAKADPFYRLRQIKESKVDE